MKISLWFVAGEWRVMCQRSRHQVSIYSNKNHELCFTFLRGFIHEANLPTIGTKQRELLIQVDLTAVRSTPCENFVHFSSACCR